MRVCIMCVYSVPTACLFSVVCVFENTCLYNVGIPFIYWFNLVLWLCNYQQFCSYPNNHSELAL